MLKTVSLVKLSNNIRARCQSRAVKTPLRPSPAGGGRGRSQ